MSVTDLRKACMHKAHGFTEPACLPVFRMFLPTWLLIVNIGNRGGLRRQQALHYTHECQHATVNQGFQVSAATRCQQAVAEIPDPSSQEGALDHGPPPSA